jgi:hypothetical protein
MVSIYSENFVAFTTDWMAQRLCLKLNGQLIKKLSAFKGSIHFINTIQGTHSDLGYGIMLVTMIDISSPCS